LNSNSRWELLPEPSGNYSVDFYAPAAKIAIEVDGEAAF
jgi:very-short-patch-repair endonuclease